jgi:tranposase-like protein
LKSHLKYVYGNKYFWAKGLFVSNVGLNTKVIEDYIRNQEKEDMVQDNLSTKEHVGLFKKVIRT